MDGIKVLDVRHTADMTSAVTGEPYRVEITLDTNGLGRDIAIEQVLYRSQDGEERLAGTRQFKVVKEEGSVLTYELSAKVKDAGMFRYGYRIYPINPNLPHRMDFAYTRWI